MKYYKFITLSIISILLASCEDNRVSFGTVEYYPSFLWSEENISPVTKTFEFEFSEDAKNDKKTYAEFQFVDNNGSPISTDVMQVYDEGIQLEENKFRVQSNVTSKELIFTFSPNASNGKHQGSFKLINHNLDRIESQLLKAGDQADVFQWTLHYDKTMNPLANTLLWIAIAIIACLLLWFLILRPSIYPHFGKFKKSILIEKNGSPVCQMNCEFKGSRKVVFYNQKVKQPIIERIFIGEIRTLVNPNFTIKLTFSPRKRNAAAYGTGYTVTPNPIPRNGIATITNTQQQLKLTLR